MNHLELSCCVFTFFIQSETATFGSYVLGHGTFAGPVFGQMGHFWSVKIWSHLYILSLMFQTIPSPRAILMCF